MESSISRTRSVSSRIVSPAGETTLYWAFDVTGRVEIHVDQPDGPLFALGNPSGSKKTGRWVKDGMTFFILEEGTGETLATVTVKVTREGC